jgi:hypothetical protein
MMKKELNNLPDKGRIIARAVSIPNHQGNVIETILDDTVYSRVDSEEVLPLTNMELKHKTSKDDFKRFCVLSCLLTQYCQNCLERKN